MYFVVGIFYIPYLLINVVISFDTATLQLFVGDSLHVW